MKVFFITGNKRSGTSQLVRMLNLHPHIFISHESDCVWILYQFHNNRSFTSHPWDSPLGMETTLKTCGSLLDKNKTPKENFFTIQRCVMEQGNPWCPPMKKAGLLWVGDKKPFQYTDPQLIDFILSMFSEAYFIHLVRHPFAVACSVECFNKTDAGDFWKNLTLKEAVQQWAFHEKGVLELKKNKAAKVLDVRYEDFCQNTKKELKRIFNFLDLNTDKKILNMANRNTRCIMRDMPYIPCSDEVRSIMEQYGYKPKGIKKNALVYAYRKLCKIF